MEYLYVRKPYRLPSPDCAGSRDRYRRNLLIGIIIVFSDRTFRLAAQVSAACHSIGEYSDRVREENLGQEALGTEGSLEFPL
jgi:hypothetical protein